ncbi:unnamed protein product [Parnassius apollo]|uniref:Carboxylic ester hydrolase n=1 Tax=Parnassius apollo TaxID=110799 RepID=A0A8S3XGU1_PARAO|nr:unnamed protein product [Parnassius apollo]
MATVSIQQGLLKGGKSQNDNGFQYYEFLGIPYAKPPVGDLRFKSPQSPEAWEGERDVTVANKENTAMQIDMIGGKVIGSEDCLYLNVYTPTLPHENAKLLPVMVFIHGGGFIHGNGILKSENGPNFLIEHNTVIVTINYRLSIFGFLSLDIPEAAGNMGLKDQVKALQWVQNNICHFGGDKDNVTIFGVSAGAASVEYLIVSPMAKGLFHKAILQSGSCLNHWAVNYEIKKLAYKVAEKLGYKESEEDNVAIYKFLLNTSGNNLAATAFQISEEYTEKRIFFGFVPTIEKDFNNGEAFLTEQPYRLLKQGLFSHVPVIKGFCDKEGYLMNMMKPKAILDVLDKQNFIESWSFNFDTYDNTKYSAKFLQTYSENIQPEDDKDKLAVDFFGDLDFVSGIWVSGKLMAQRGVPVRFYEFSYDGKLNFFKLFFGVMRKGAAHVDDVGYVLSNEITKKADEEDLIVRNTMSKMWTNFATFGSPTPDGNLDNLVEWPLYTEKDPVYLSINKEIKAQSNYKPNKMTIFEEIYEKYEK